MTHSRKELILSIVLLLSGIAIGYVWGYNRNLLFELKHSTSVQKSIHLNNINDYLTTLSDLNNNGHSQAELRILAYIQKNLDDLTELSGFSQLNSDECMFLKHNLNIFKQIDLSGHTGNYSDIALSLSSFDCELLESVPR